MVRPLASSSAFARVAPLHLNDVPSCPSLAAHSHWLPDSTEKSHRHAPLARPHSCIPIKGLSTASLIPRPFFAETDP